MTGAIYSHLVFQPSAGCRPGWQVPVTVTWCFSLQMSVTVTWCVNLQMTGAIDSHLVFQPSAAQQVADLSDKKEKEGEEKPTIGSFGTKMDAYAKKMLKVGRRGRPWCCWRSEPLTEGEPSLTKCCRDSPKTPQVLLRKLGLGSVVYTRVNWQMWVLEMCISVQSCFCFLPLKISLMLMHVLGQGSECILK